MRPPEIILRNSARCLQCGDEVESTHRHDFRTCTCGKLGVDGGHDYIRRIGSFGQNTSIVAIREIDDPQTTAGALDFLDQITSASRPAPSDYADAPVLRNWRLHVINIARSPARVLIGTVTGHPEFVDGTLMATTRILAGDQNKGWVRKTRRFYRLGDRQS